MTLRDLLTIGVPTLAVLAGWASQRAAAKATRLAAEATARASVTNTDATNRTDMEREAYIRARTFDTETIARQDAELAEVRAENVALRAEVSALRADVAALRSEVREGTSP